MSRVVYLPMWIALSINMLGKKLSGCIVSAHFGIGEAQNGVRWDDQIAVAFYIKIIKGTK
jgi:hypothetical protein